MIKNLPNFISIYRLVTIPFVAWFLLEELYFYAALFTTDKVEGYVDFLGNGDKFVLLLSQNKINAVNLGPYYRISLDD